MTQPRAIALLVTVAVLPGLPAQLCGDCNQDGAITIVDALTGAQIAVALLSPTPPQITLCDTDASGAIQVVDALLMAQSAAGLPVALTCPGVAPTCAFAGPGIGPHSGDVTLAFDTDDPDSATIQVTVEVSLDGGATWLLATPALTSPAPFHVNPATGVTPGPGQSFIWSSPAEVPGTAIGAELRLTVTDGTFTGSCQTTVDVDNSTPQPPTPGDLLITEVLQNPAAVGDAMGEWFEILNLSGLTRDLEGCTVRDRDVDSHVIAAGAPLLIPPGGRLVLGSNADPGTNGAVTVDYEYSGIALANGDDELIIEDPLGLELVRIEWDGGPLWPDPNGASMNLDDGITLPLLARDGATWCAATLPWGSGTDLGSPGVVNESCSLPPLPPVCLLGSLPRCQGGDLTVVFTTADADSPTIDVTVLYSTDTGATFLPCSVAASSPPPYTSNPALGVTPGPGQQLVWATLTDLGATSQSVLVQVLVDDGSSTTTCLGPCVPVDNLPVNAPPACAITSPAGGSVPLGDIPVDVDLADADSAAVQVLVEYSTDGGLTHAPATAAATSPPPLDGNPATCVVPAAGLTFLWCAACDVGTPGSVEVRITVEDCVSASTCTTSFTLAGGGAVPPSGPGQLVLSEIHADPEPTLAGDANGDGIRDSSEDEFVELVNITAGALDLSGVTIEDAVTVRHTCPPGTVVPSGGAVVVFGGGVPTGSFGGNVVQIASSGMLGLNNGGDTVTVRNAATLQLELYAYGSEGGNDQAIVRNPEPETATASPGGPMVLHTTLPPGLLFSPGTRADGLTGAW